MDPNVCMDRIAGLLNDLLDETDEAERLTIQMQAADAVNDLRNWLARGGFKPTLRFNTELDLPVQLLEPGTPDPRD